MTIEHRTALRKQTVALETVTPDMARLWLTSRAYKGQRNLKANHVKFLAEEMERFLLPSHQPCIFHGKNLLWIR